MSKRPGPTDGTRNTRLVNATLPGNQSDLGELVHTPLHFRYECSAAADLLLQIPRHDAGLHGFTGSAHHEPPESRQDRDSCLERHELVGCEWRVGSHVTSITLSAFIIHCV